MTEQEYVNATSLKALRIAEGVVGEVDFSGGSVRGSMRIEFIRSEIRGLINELEAVVVCDDPDEEGGTHDAG